MIDFDFVYQTAKVSSYIAHSGGQFRPYLRGSATYMSFTMTHLFGEIPGSFNSSQINACVVGIEVLGPLFIVSSEGLGFHKMLPPRGFELSTSSIPGKHLPLGHGSPYYGFHFGWCFHHHSNLNQNQLLWNHLWWNARIFQFLTDECMRRGNSSVRTLVYSLFQRTRAAQNVAPKGIRTSRMPGKHRTSRPRLPLLWLSF